MRSRSASPTAVAAVLAVVVLSSVLIAPARAAGGPSWVGAGGEALAGAVDHRSQRSVGTGTLVATRNIPGPARGALREVGRELDRVAANPKASLDRVAGAVDAFQEVLSDIEDLGLTGELGKEIAGVLPKAARAIKKLLTMLAESCASTKPRGFTDGLLASQMGRRLGTTVAGLVGRPWLASLDRRLVRCLSLQLTIAGSVRHTTADWDQTVRISARLQLAFRPATGDWANVAPVAPTVEVANPAVPKDCSLVSLTPSTEPVSVERMVAVPGEGTPAADLRIAFNEYDMGAWTLLATYSCGDDTSDAGLPGFGYLFLMNHAANSTSDLEGWTGLPGYPVLAEREYELTSSLGDGTLSEFSLLSLRRLPG